MTRIVRIFLSMIVSDENNPDFELLNEAIKLSKELANFVNLRIRESENESRWDVTLIFLYFV